MGKPIPKIKLNTAVNSSINSRLPIDSSSTKSARTSPTPVWETAPTMIPAAAVAIPIPIMLRAPEIKPSRRSIKPSVKLPWLKLWSLRIQFSNGRWVIKISISITLPQNADNPGDKRSTIKHQTNTTTGKIKCRPDSSTSFVFGSTSIGLSEASAGSGGFEAAIFNKPK